jgi:hypothetical protein
MTFVEYCEDHWYDSEMKLPKETIIELAEGYAKQENEELIELLKEWVDIKKAYENMQQHVEYDSINKAEMKLFIKTEQTLKHK